MKNSMQKFLLVAFFAMASAPAMADWTAKDASGTTITFKNPGTCSSVVCVPETQLVDSTGTTLVGTAGTAAAGVLTVQGIASGTNLNVAVTSAVGLAQGSTTSGQTGSLIMGAVTTTTPSYTTAQTNNISLDVKGNQRVVLGGGTPITASATGTTAATTATLATSASVTTYICGFSIRANANAAATGNATVTGVITGTMNFTQWTAPNTSGLGVTEEVFTPCISASAANTSIAVVSAAPGTGGVVSVSAWGYQQ